MQSPTSDSFLNGGIRLAQPRSGYRFSIDAVILAHLVDPPVGSTVLDLGTGCGVISIILAYRHPTLRIAGVEVQSTLAELARHNVIANQMADRIRIVEKDMRDLSSTEIGGPVDLVVTNPPYRKLGSGRINIHSQRAVARHELRIDLHAVLLTARQLLAPSGRIAIIYPSERTVDLLAAMRLARLEPKILTMIHSTRSSSARLVAVHGVNGGRPGLDVAPALYLYQDDGTYTPALETMLSR